ncbi:MAG: Glycoside hydrolase, family 57, partial [Leptospirillum sp. Group IV 'UBA BS']
RTPLVPSLPQDGRRSREPWPKLRAVRSTGWPRVPGSTMIFASGSAIPRTRRDGISLGGQGWPLRKPRKGTRETRLSSETGERARAGTLCSPKDPDWFWWYGDDFKSLQSSVVRPSFPGPPAECLPGSGAFSPHSPERTHPGDRHGGRHHASGGLHPSVSSDGEVTHYFEWTGAGFIDNHKLQGSMYLQGFPPRGDLLPL